MSLHDLVLQHDFDSAHRSAVVRDLVAVVSRHSNRLVSWREAQRGGIATTAPAVGVRAVAVDRIVGSVDRVDDFDRDFRPRRRHSSGRWQRVARAHADGHELPPVRLREVGGRYFVEDGHHRVSVARRYGQRFIDAEVPAVTIVDVAAADSSASPGAIRRLAGWASARAAAWRGFGVGHPWLPATHHATHASTHSPRGHTTCIPTPSTCG